jgi:hypothetical protein
MSGLKWPLLPLMQVDPGGEHIAPRPRRDVAHASQSPSHCIPDSVLYSVHVLTTYTRIRRVRCDEGKPACNHCVSTGCTCDGYTSPSTDSSTASSSSSKSPSPIPLHPKSPNPVADLKLILPRQNPEEVRSYNYFLQVTAPSLSGAFYADFWLVEVPRVCLSDAAIWHAVVSLGAAHEDFAENGLGSRSIFALKQFNSSISCLTESRSPRHADRWRALVVSAIFTYVCTIKGLMIRCGYISRLDATSSANFRQNLQSRINYRRLPCHQFRYQLHRYSLF